MYMILKSEYFYLVLVYMFLSTYFSRKKNMFNNYTQHQKMRQGVYFDIFDNFTFFIIRKNWNTVILNEKAMVY